MTDKDLALLKERAIVAVETCSSNSAIYVKDDYHALQCIESIKNSNNFDEVRSAIKHYNHFVSSGDNYQIECNFVILMKADTPS